MAVREKIKIVEGNWSRNLSKEEAQKEVRGIIARGLTKSFRKKLVAGNWKMNLTRDEALNLVREIAMGSKNTPCELAVFPSFLFLHEVAQTLAGSGIATGAQNCCEHENGALTGEVSAQQLKDSGAQLVLVGHSERRGYYDENDLMLRDKLQIALKHGLKPVFCCGERLLERKAGQAKPYVENQLKRSLFPLSKGEISSVIIAYEPVWAIGSGLNAMPEQAQEMHAYIRSLLGKKYGEKIGAQTRIIYGGSCKPSNAAQLFACPDVDGGLIGGASLNAKDFLAIAKAAQ